MTTKFQVGDRVKTPMGDGEVKSISGDQYFVVGEWPAYAANVTMGSNKGYEWFREDQLKRVVAT